ncbi:MAG: hypothetical protein ACE5KO_03510, partial [Candidatus Bathyarchaeia archaeon]
MASSVGWLLDAYVENNSAILWFKTDNGNVIRLHDDFFPDFFLEPQSGIDIECLRNKLLDHPCISGVDEKRRFTALGAREKSDVLRIFVNGIVSFRSVLRSLHDLRPREVKAFYNTDLTHIQRYLFSRNLLPTAKVEFQFNNSRKYLGASQINDEEELKPPFSMLTFDLGIDSQTLTPNPYVDPIGRIFIT